MSQSWKDIHNNRSWMRKCQECGNQQIDTEPPNTQPSYDKWAEHKCRKCQSTALDYGKWFYGNSGE